MSAALTATHYCSLPTGRAITPNNEEGSVFRGSRLIAFKAHSATLKSTTGDSLKHRLRALAPEYFNAYLQL